MELKTKEKKRFVSNTVFFCSKRKSSSSSSSSCCCSGSSKFVLSTITQLKKLDDLWFRSTVWIIIELFFDIGLLFSLSSLLLLPTMILVLVWILEMFFGRLESRPHFSVRTQDKMCFFLYEIFRYHQQHLRKKYKS